MQWPAAEHRGAVQHLGCTHFTLQKCYIYVRFCFSLTLQRKRKMWKKRSFRCSSSEKSVFFVLFCYFILGKLGVIAIQAIFALYFLFVNFFVYFSFPRWGRSNTFYMWRNGCAKENYDPKYKGDALKNIQIIVSLENTRIYLKHTLVSTFC